MAQAAANASSSSYQALARSLSRSVVVPVVVAYVTLATSSLPAKGCAPSPTPAGALLLRERSRSVATWMPA